MSYNVNPPEEFIKATPRAFQFEVAPLDVELAQLVFKMTKRLPDELPANGWFPPITERHQPTWTHYLELGLIELTCQPGEKVGLREMAITFWDKAHSTPYRFLLAHGTTQTMLDFINADASLYHCKCCALWVNHLLKH